MTQKLQTEQKSIASKDGVKIVYDILRTPHAKHTLILLHGLGGDLSDWEMERLLLQEQNIQTLAIDLRGHGFSDKPNDHSAYAIPHLVEDIVAIVQKEKLHPSALVGHCFGGMIALATIAAHPKLAQSLILVDSNFKAPFFGASKASVAFLEKIASLYHAYFQTPSARERADYHPFIGGGDFDIRRITSDIMHTSFYAYFETCKNVLEFDGGDYLEKIQLPTLVVSGTDDRVFPPSVARQLASRIVNSQLAFIPGANHIIVINNPKELTETMYTFIKSL